MPMAPDPMTIRDFGIAFGFIAWTAIKLLSGRYRELNPALVILSILFVIKLGWFNA